MIFALACQDPEDASPLPRDQWPDLSDTDTDTDTDADADADADADTDADADADTDTDTDADTDTDTEPAGTGGSGGPVGEGSAAIGSSSYAYYAPPCAAEAHPVAVVYSMHGSGGNGASMVASWRSLAEAECFVVVGLDSESGMSWNFDGDVANTAELLDTIDGGYDVGARYLHGYSAGAHWTWVIGLANTSTFAGFGVFAGSMSYAEAWGHIRSLPTSSRSARAEGATLPWYPQARGSRAAPPSHRAGRVRPEG